MILGLAFADAEALTTPDDDDTRVDVSKAVPFMAGAVWRSSCSRQHRT